MSGLVGPFFGLSMVAEDVLLASPVKRNGKGEISRQGQASNKFSRFRQLGCRDGRLVCQQLRLVCILILLELLVIDVSSWVVRYDDHNSDIAGHS